MDAGSPRTLDDAWKAAEAALPQGCVLDGIRRIYDDARPDERWVARAAWPDTRNLAGTMAIEFDYGSTPAEALLALAARLNEGRDG